MNRWKVRKSPSGQWWAHEPGCALTYGLSCHIWRDCNSIRSFSGAVAYANFMACGGWP